MTARPPRSLGRTAGAGLALAFVLFLTAAVPTTSASAPAVSHPTLTWHHLSPKHSPAARAWTAMSDDPAAGYVVLYGGFNGALSLFLNDTWTYANGTWTELHPVHTPVGEVGMVLAYDPALKGVVTFGGRWGFSDAASDQTWLFRSGTWTRVVTATSPSARSSYAMAYDPTTDEIVLFGGVSATGATLSDTWAFNGTAWTRLAGPHPDGREFASMVYDAASSWVLLNGGVNASGTPLHGGTWAFAAGGWTHLTAANSPPEPTFAYVGALNGTPVYFGGSVAHGSTLRNETVEFTAGAWIAARAPGAPSPRNNGAATWDSEIGAFLIFSGYVGSSTTGMPLYSGQTWSLT